MAVARMTCPGDPYLGAPQGCGSSSRVIRAGGRRTLAVSRPRQLATSRFTRRRTGRRGSVFLDMIYIVGRNLAASILRTPTTPEPVVCMMKSEIH